MADTLNNLGNVLSIQGDYASARINHDGESGHQTRELGDRSGIAVSLLGLGNVACAPGGIMYLCTDLLSREPGHQA